MKKRNELTIDAQLLKQVLAALAKKLGRRKRITINQYFKLFFTVLHDRQKI
jgi:hypothetical protein